MMQKNSALDVPYQRPIPPRERERAENKNDALSKASRSRKSFFMLVAAMFYSCQPIIASPRLQLRKKHSHSFTRRDAQ